MTNIRGLDPWGPFERKSQHRWIGNRPAQYDLDMAAYQQAFIDTGAPPEVARAIVARLQQHGCEQIFWRFANGRRFGRLNAFWDLRVATTTTPAHQAVPAVTSMGPTPPGAIPLDFLSHHRAVLQAYSTPAQTHKVRATRQILGARTPLTGTATTRFSHTAYAALAVGHIGATLSTGAQSQTTAEAALGLLADLLLRDIDHP